MSLFLIREVLPEIATTLFDSSYNVLQIWPVSILIRGAQKPN
jgi:hypothetical protein